MPIAEVVGKAVLESVKETSKEFANSKIDPRKRVEVDKAFTPKLKSGVDVNKRIESKNSKGLNEIANDLTSKQKNELKKDGMSLFTISNCKYLDGIYKIKTKADALIDKIIPETGVKYLTKMIDLFGKVIEGVFPEFKSLFDCQLPTELLKASDTKQFKYCNSQLQDAINKNSALKEQFSPRQLEQINAGKTPGGYVWHHNEKVGKMELVDSKIHSMTVHTGGRAIWGGGKDNR